MDIDLDQNGSIIELIPLNLTDVIEDCLEHIFDNLDMEDLYYVALTNKELAKIAQMVFKKKFGTTRFYVNFCQQFIQFTYQNEFHSVSSMNVFTFVRLFGKVMSFERITFSHSSVMYPHIGDYLKALSLEFIESKLYDCQHAFDEPDFHQFNSKELSLYLERELDPQEACFEVSPDFKSDNSLIIHLSNKYFIVLAARLPNHVNELSIDCDSYKSSTNVTFEHVNKFSFFWRHKTVESRTSKLCPSIYFTQLEDLTLSGPFALTGKWFEFITRNKNLIRLSLAAPYTPESTFKNEEWLNLIAALPKLKVLEFDRRLMNDEFFINFNRNYPQYSVDLHSKYYDYSTAMQQN